MPKVHIRTYGCQMNERDSEQVAQMFADGGYTVTADETDADAILVNTCSVRDQAEQKALELSKKLKEDWTVTLSHEALELVGDPEANLLVQGPHPEHPKRQVFHWFEMCDAVQAETYGVDGIEVSNFVLPLYFTSSAERGGRNDFLGVKHRGKTLQSFGVNPGGYIGFYDPKLRGEDKNTTFELDNDPRALRRQRIKRQLETGRGMLRRRRAVVE